MTAKQTRAKIEAVRKFLPAWSAYTDCVLGFVENRTRKTKPSAAKFGKLFRSMRKLAKPLQSEMTNLRHWTRHDGPCLFVGSTVFDTFKSLSTDIRLDRVFAETGEGEDPLNRLVRIVGRDCIEYIAKLDAILPAAKDKPEPRRIILTELQQHILFALLANGEPCVAKQLAVTMDHEGKYVCANESSIRRAINGTGKDRSQSLRGMGLVSSVRNRGGYFLTASGRRKAAALSRRAR